MAIISRSHANRLVREGKAVKDGSWVDPNDGQRYQIVKRRDQIAATVECRLDRYPLASGQMAQVQVH